MENSNNDKTKYIIIALVALIVIVVGFFLLRGKSNNETPTPTPTPTPAPVASEYKLYSRLDNQGWYDSVIGYNGELLFISETGDEEGEYTEGTCYTKIKNGEVEFTNDQFECTYEDNEEYSGFIKKLNIQENAVKNVYVKQSFRSDGATIVFVVFTDGKVNSYDFFESGSVNEDIFQGYNVSEITKYECTKYNDGCQKEKYTVILDDGSTKEL